MGYRTVAYPTSLPLEKYKNLSDIINNQKIFRDLLINIQ